MKNFIPLILAILFIGAGCVFEKPVVLDADLMSEPAVTIQTFTGVVTESDDATRTFTILLSDGSTEQVETTENQPTPGFGLVYRFVGERELSTRVVMLSELTDLSTTNLIVVSPEQNATVISPLVVTGFGRVFEQTFAWRIKDNQGAIVQEGNAMTNASDTGQFGPFSFEVFLPALTDVHLTLEVLEFSAKDGTEQSVVSIPLTLLSTNTSTFSLWFSNNQKGSLEDCSETFPVSRTIAQTSAIGRGAIGELLKGPTELEKTQGYYSHISPTVVLESLVISNHVANADFSPQSQLSGDTCRAKSARSSIEGTLLQFETVESVMIRIGGILSTP